MPPCATCGQVTDFWIERKRNWRVFSANFLRLSGRFYSLFPVPPCSSIGTVASPSLRLAVVLSGSAAKGYTAPMVVGRMAEVMSNLLLQQFPNSTTQYCKNKSMISRISRSVKQLMTNICANQPPKHETLT